LDTKFELSAFQLRRLEPDTSDIACSLLPTPTVPNGGRVNPLETTRTGKRPDGSKAQVDLYQTIKVELSATPAVNGNHNRKGASVESGDGISTQAKLTATPSARDWKNGQASQNTVDRNSRPLNEQVISSIASEASGTLSPRFVEEYQGYEIDHTALRPSAIPCVPPKPIRSSKRSRKSKQT
jgi:hypothetical protein